VHPPPVVIDTNGLTDTEAMRDLATTYVRVFKENAPDQDNVVYYSIGARKRLRLLNPQWATQRVIHAGGKD